MNQQNYCSKDGQCHYNCVRPHQTLGGKTPAQAARMEVPNNWKGLIDEATKHEAQILANITKINTQATKSRNRGESK